MKMSVTNRYDARVDQVFALLSDPSWLEQMNRATGATDFTVESLEQQDGAVRIVTSRKVTVDLPGFARKVMQPTNTVLQTDDWSPVEVDGARVCHYSVEVKGVPSRIDGAMTLRAEGSECVQEIVAEMKVAIPLLGGRLEKVAVESGRKEIAAQAEWIRTRL